jgi:Autotransporter beta-domain
VKTFRTLAAALIALAIPWMAATPARAQLAAGCACPAGYVPSGPTACTGFLGVVPAICTGATINQINQIVGQVAVSQQQLSFSGIQSVIQARRDQLQGAVGTARSTSSVSGYSPANFNDAWSALGYANQSQRTNPLAVYNKVPPAPTVDAGPSLATWAQGLGDWEHRGAVDAADIGRFSSTYGAQAGFDETWQNVTAGGGSLVLGMIGSWMSSHVTFDNSPTAVRMTGPGIGLYGTFVQGGFSVDLTPKFDFLELTEELSQTQSVNLTNAGLSGNTQYKVKLGENSFVEPTGGFSFTRTVFDSGAPLLGLKDASTMRVQAGARWGTAWDSNGISIESSLKTIAYTYVVAEGASISTTTAGAAIAPTDRDKIRGEIGPALDVSLPNNYTITLSGQMRFGEELVGGSATFTLRKQW